MARYRRRQPWRRYRGQGLGPAGPFAAPLEDWVHNLIVAGGIEHLSRHGHGGFMTSDLVQALLEIADEDSNDFAKAFEARLIHYRRTSGGKKRRPRAPAQPIRRNLSHLGKLLGLDRLDLELLSFLVAVATERALAELVEDLLRLPRAHRNRCIADILHRDRSEITRALDASARLFTSGVIRFESVMAPGEISVMPDVIDALFEPRLDEAIFIDRLFPPAEATTLAWEDFAHVSGVDLLRDLLGAAAAGEARGVHVLLYGPTGVGKTELARAVAGALGLSLRVVGREGDEGSPPSPNERLASLKMGLQLGEAGKTVLLFDEAEDLFGQPLEGSFPFGRARRDLSKQWFNDLLEGARLPVIWISNTTSRIDAAYLRRFSLVVEVPAPGARQRERALATHLGDDHDLSAAEIRSLAERFTVSPGSLASATRAARLVAEDGRPTAEILEAILEPAQKVLTGRRPPRRALFDPDTYRLDLLCTDTDLDDLAAAVSAHGSAALGLSLCLYGPPGTGKSAFVRYLAHSSGRPLVYRRASDILSMWVGGTEQNIAAAFDEARACDGILLFDEVDTFLRSRGLADRSWEVSRVNELLEQMETFDGIVACTTNLWDDLDPAALRRFVFKVRFDYLSGQAAIALFETLFACALEAHGGRLAEPERRRLSRLRALTPGDLAVVARRLRALGATPDPAQIVADLEAEIALKRDRPRAVGF